MASITTILLTLLAVIASSEATDHLFQKPASLNVFKRGIYTPVRVDTSISPKSLVIFSPKEAGVYPILFFVHGFDIPNYEYTELFNFTASHGIIVVAPMLFTYFGIIPIIPSQQQEIDDAADVANWLALNINTAKPNILPEQVTANFDMFAMSGHSRGGKTAFALVLGYTKKTTLNVKVSALLAVDPVAGNKVGFVERRSKPYVLTKEANSLNISVPTTIIGTGVGTSCTPKGLSHAQFYKECVQASYFVISNYGHCDMLNDNNPLASLLRTMCGSGKRGTYDIMRRTLGGIMVAFIDAYFGGSPAVFNEILSNPSLAPTKLHPVDEKGLSQQYYDA
ncbi:chlorophyllase type 0-like [Silene latifolia]|uniref:chlorophyllase type 0-like n=1 Tax=Silene latifolia TaxID=37657 RepID=UPI003D782BB2